MHSKKRVPAALLAALLLCTTGMAALAQEDINRHRECNHCGMDRKAFGYSRMLIRYEGGTEIGVCSLHCAVVEISGNRGKKVKELLVADRDGRELVSVEKAVWVLGGKKPGVMTRRAKWAFATKEGAAAFVKAYGGEIVPWSRAFEAALEDYEAARKPVR
jgi:nitrous oxide reductase accessory protein NosL